MRYKHVSGYKNRKTRRGKVRLPLRRNLHINKKLILATVYRPPKLQAADYTALYNEIQSLVQSRNAVFLDDFNCANTDWDLLIWNQEGCRLLHMVEDSFLTQVTTQPTRENNILDQVLLSDADLIRDCEVREKTKWLQPQHYPLQRLYSVQTRRQSYSGTRLPKG